MSIDIRIKQFNQDKIKKGSYTVDEVSIMLNVTRQTVYKLIKLDFFKVRKFSTGYRIEKESFDKWLDNE